MLIRVRALIFFLLLGLGSQGFSVPFAFTYAGKLLDNSGAALSGTQSVKITFWDAQTGGSQLAANQQTGATNDTYSVNLVNGVFSQVVNLSAANFHLVFPDDTTGTWVQVEAAGITYPRQQFTAVPYALKVPVDNSTITYNSSGELQVSSIGSVANLNAATTLSTTSAGSAAAPALFFGGDTNTGIYSSGADSLSMSTNGQSRLTIDSSGNVGIGTSPSTAKLEVGGQGVFSISENDSEAIRIGNKSGGAGNITGKTWLGLTHWNTTENFSSARIGVVESGTASYRSSIAFATRDSNSDSMPTEKVRIDPEGRLGIGTPTPTELIDVKGANAKAQIVSSSTSSAGGGSGLNLISDDGGAMGSAGERLGYILFSGNNGSSANQAGASVEAATSETWSSIKSGTDLIFKTTNTGTAGRSEKMRISANGRIGIGTSTPLARFEVNDTESHYKVVAGGSVNGGIAFLSNGAVNSAAGDSVSFYSYLYSNQSVSNLYHFRATPPDTTSGTIGTAYGLFIGDSISHNATNSMGVRSQLTSGTNKWNIYSGGTAQNYFAGNVGIGTSRTTPSSALDVNGDITITDKVTHSADTNTSIRFPANDTVAITTDGTERLRVRSDGNVAIGGVGVANSQLSIQSPLSGGTAVNGVYANQTVGSDVTSAASVFRTFVGTQAASFTLPTLVHFNTTQNTFNTGSTVTSQIGFYAGRSLTGAVSNYGFRSDIENATNRWNFYALGTAPNYFAGNVGIGTTDPAAKLDVAGEVKFGNTSSTCNATNEGQQRYNSTSKNMEFCNGTAWTAYGTSGRTSCPSGFTMIGTSGSADAFCISTSEESGRSWLNAVTNCYNKSPRARLCSSGEWVMACVSGLVSGMTGNWEWVADLDHSSTTLQNRASIMGASSCSSASYNSNGTSYTSRCCFR